MPELEKEWSSVTVECQKNSQGHRYILEFSTGDLRTLDVSFTVWLKEMIVKEIEIPKGNPLCQFYVTMTMAVKVTSVRE